MKNILFLMPAMNGGGAERTLLNLLNKINFLNYSIDLVVISNNGVLMKEIPKEVHLITLLNNDFLARLLAYLQKRIGLFFVLRWLLKLKVKKKYDVGISFLDGETTDLLFLIKGLNKKYSWVHSSYQTNDNFARFYKNKEYKKKLTKNRYSKLDGIYFVSNDAKEEFTEVFGKYQNMQVIYNLIDAETVKVKAKQENNISNNMFTFLALGSLMPVKGFDRLIRASNLVKAKGHEFKVKIIGSGNELTTLQNLIDKFNLNNNVSLLGFKSNPYPELKACDVFIMSSLSEALPTVLCEAMILGKPVLVTKCSGCKELVDNEKYGLLSEQNDEDLADKMIDYIKDQSLKTFYEGQSLIRSKIFDDNVILNEYYKIFNT
jgi:glycosyltransferase involved in cell wall biosynthesis